MNDQLIDEIVTYAYDMGWDGIPETLEGVINYMFKLSQNGDAQAMFYYGGFLLGNPDHPDDIEKGIEYLQKSASLGYEEATAFLNFYNSLSEEDAIPELDETLIERAENGDAEAQVLLGTAYITGEGIAQDHEKGFFWIEKSALQGNSSAISIMGQCYHNGIGVEENLDKAIEWFEKAAVGGNPDVQYDLGNIYLEEFPGNEDKRARGLYWLKTAGDNGHQKAASYYAFNMYIDKAIAEGKISADADMFEKMFYVGQQADNGDEEAQKCFLM